MPPLRCLLLLHQASARLVKVVGAGGVLLGLAGHGLAERHRAHRLVALDHLGRASGQLLLGGRPASRQHVGDWHGQKRGEEGSCWHRHHPPPPAAAAPTHLQRRMTCTLTASCPGLPMTLLARDSGLPLAAIGWSVAASCGLSVPHAGARGCQAVLEVSCVPRVFSRHWRGAGKRNSISCSGGTNRAVHESGRPNHSPFELAAAPWAC